MSNPATADRTARLQQRITVLDDFLTDTQALADKINAQITHLCLSEEGNTAFASALRRALEGMNNIAEDFEENLQWQKEAAWVVGAVDRQAGGASA